MEWSPLVPLWVVFWTVVYGRELVSVSLHSRALAPRRPMRPGCVRLACFFAGLWLALFPLVPILLGFGFKPQTPPQIPLDSQDQAFLKKLHTMHCLYAGAFVLLLAMHRLW